MKQYKQINDKDAIFEIVTIEYNEANEAGEVTVKNWVLKSNMQSNELTYSDQDFKANFVEFVAEAE